MLLVRDNNHPSIVLLLLGLLLFSSGSVWAEDSPEIETQVNEVALADSLFSLIAEAWNADDEGFLASIVHPDGVRINTGGKVDRLTRYSPSQAFYFFKNLFQKRKTSEFSFLRVQENDDQDRSHAWAIWVWQQDSQKQAQEEEFIFVLQFKQDRWFLSEINSIK